MSGKTKRKLYTIYLCVFGLAALAGVVLLAYFGGYKQCEREFPWLVFAFAAICLMNLSPNVLVHEGGHLLFGWLAGMRFYALSVARLKITRRGVKWAGRQNVAGETQMIPRGGKGVRARTVVFALGGALSNFVYGGVFLALFFVLPVTPALLFFELFAPLSLFEGMTAVFPVRLSAGRTDGEVLRGLILHLPEAENYLAVTTAQGLLFAGSYSSLPRELLFSAPVVAEDEPAFLALLSLRARYLYSVGEEEAAFSALARLDGLKEYLPEEEARALSAEIGLFRLASGKEREESVCVGGTAGVILNVLAGEKPGTEAKKAIKKEPLRGERELFTLLWERGEKQNAIKTQSKGE